MPLIAWPKTVVLLAQNQPPPLEGAQPLRLYFGFILYVQPGNQDLHAILPKKSGDIGSTRTKKFSFDFEIPGYQYTAAAFSSNAISKSRLQLTLLSFCSPTNWNERSFTLSLLLSHIITYQENSSPSAFHLARFAQLSYNKHVNHGSNDF